jgi:transposase
MTPAPGPADDVETLRAALATECEARIAAEARATGAEARATGAEARAVGAEAVIEHLKLVIAKQRHDKFGASSERGRKLLGQLELELGELVATVAEDAAKAESQAGRTAWNTTTTQALTGAAARPPAARAGGAAIPLRLPLLRRQAVQAGRGCHRDPRGGAPVVEGRSDGAGEVLLPGLRDHHPAARAIPPDRPWQGGAEPAGDGAGGQVWPAPAAEPAKRELRPRGRRAQRLHPGRLGRHCGRRARAAAGARQDGYGVPVDLCAGRPALAGPAPPAALFYFSSDRTAKHPRRHLASYAGILQADAYAGYDELYRAGRKPGPVTEAACWAHFRRKVFELAEVARAPLAAEAVQYIDRVFEAERAVNGCPAADRLAHRQRIIAPLMAELQVWMLETRGRLSRHNELARALDYALKRWPAFTKFLDAGRICLTNNAAERALRGIALGRKAWLFAGSDRGGERAAMIYTLIITAKLNDAAHPASRLDELLPWNWHRIHTLATAAA